MAMRLLLAEPSASLQDFGERSEALEKMRFAVRFEGKQRSSSLLLDKLKQSIEINGSLTHRQMGVTVAVVIMEVNFPQPIAESFEPVRQGGPGKAVLMPDVQAKPEIRRRELGKQLLMQPRVVLPHVFH
jgi:hypothetical protein